MPCVTSALNRRELVSNLLEDSFPDIVTQVGFKMRGGATDKAVCIIELSRAGRSPENHATPQQPLSEREVELCLMTPAPRYAVSCSNTIFSSVSFKRNAGPELLT